MQGKARDYLRQNPYDVDVYEYVNVDDLYFNGGKNRDKYYRLEGAFNLGGYILKDKLWFLDLLTRFMLRRRPCAISILARDLSISFPPQIIIIMVP